MKTHPFAETYPISDVIINRMTEDMRANGFDPEQLLAYRERRLQYERD